MNKLRTNVFLTFALACGLMIFASCSSTTPATNGSNAVVVSADSVGVPECDEYIKKVDACISSKVPEAQRAAFKSSFDTLRKSWKDAAQTPQGKSGLSTGCKAALDQAKQTYASYSCTW